MKLPSACLALLLACAPFAGRAATPTFDQWADDYAAQWVRLNPQFATRTQYFKGAEQDELDRQLGPSGAFGQLFGTKLYARYAALARQGLTDLQRYPDASLTPTQRTSAAIIRWTLENTVRNEPFAQRVTTKS